MFMVRDVLLVLREDLILLYLIVGEHSERIVQEIPVVATLLNHGVGVVAIFFLVGIKLVMIYELD